MPVLEESFIFRDLMVRNKSIYPPNCLPSPPDDIVYHPYRKHSSAKYLRESRLRPKNLLANLTSRAKVYTVDDLRGVYWKESSIPCPHDGIHGDVVNFSYTTDVSQWNEGVLFPDWNTLISKDFWSGPLREKMGARQVNLGSSLAEYRESCKMFKDLAAGLWSAYRTIRGKKKRRRIKVQDIPASVLQYNFGIAPLVNDVYSSVEMLRLRMEKPVIERVSAAYRQDRTFDGIWAGKMHSSSGSFRQRATIYVTKSNFAGLNGDFDFGNPVEWAWELIPFSFVVDWAIPIGGWLGSLDAMIGVDVVSGAVTTKTTTKTEYYPEDANRIITKGRAETSSYQRTVISSVPMASFPAWEPSLSYKRAINATALLSLLAGRILRKK